MVNLDDVTRRRDRIHGPCRVWMVRVAGDGTVGEAEGNNLIPTAWGQQTECWNLPNMIVREVCRDADCQDCEVQWSSPLNAHHFHRKMRDAAIESEKGQEFKCDGNAFILSNANLIPSKHVVYHMVGGNGDTGADHERGARRKFLCPISNGNEGHGDFMYELIRTRVFEARFRVHRGHWPPNGSRLSCGALKKKGSLQ